MGKILDAIDLIRGQGGPDINSTPAQLREHWSPEARMLRNPGAYRTPLAFEQHNRHIAFVRVADTFINFSLRADITPEQLSTFRESLNTFLQTLLLGDELLLEEALEELQVDAVNLDALLEYFCAQQPNCKKIERFVALNSKPPEIEEAFTLG